MRGVAAVEACASGEPGPVHAPARVFWACGRGDARIHEFASGNG